MQPHPLSGCLFVPVGNRLGNLAMLSLDLGDIIGRGRLIVVSEQEGTRDHLLAGQFQKFLEARIVGRIRYGQMKREIRLRCRNAVFERASA